MLSKMKDILFHKQVEFLTNFIFLDTEGLEKQSILNY